MNGDYNFQFNQNVTPTFQQTQMSQMPPQTKKSNGVKILVIILIILIILGIVGFVVYKKSSAGDSDKVKETQKEPKKEEEKGELIEVDETVANEKIKLLNIAMNYSFYYKNSTPTNWFLPGNFDYNKELLEGKNARCDIVFLSLVLQNDKDVIVGATPTGEVKDNFYGIPNNIFVKRYKDLFGEDLPEAGVYPSNVSSYLVKDGVVYGAYYEDITPLKTDMIFKELRKMDNRYILTIDVLVKDETSNVAANKDDVSDYLLKIDLIKVNDEVYTIKSAMFIEK